MKLFEFHKKSIKFRIWSSMLATIFIILIIFVIINITVLSNIKEDFYYDKLENVANVRKDKSNNTDDIVSNDLMLAAHLVIDFRNDEKKIIVDSFTSLLYKEDKKEVIKHIADEIDKDTLDGTMDKVRISNEKYYLYVVFASEDIALVYFIADNDNSREDMVRLILILIVFIMISFYTSSLIAKRISKSIVELETFSREIAKRNFDVKTPITDPDEIGRLANSLDYMKNALKTAEERDRKFLQSTSHDLKTPVMIIKGYANAIVEGVYKGSETIAAKTIITETEKLEHRIIQLLRLNTLEHSLEYRKDFEKVQLDRIVKSVLEKFKILNSEIEFRSEIKSTSIEADAASIVIVFENLLENAIRYAKSYIEIAVDDKEKTVIVKNDGDNFFVKDPNSLFDEYRKDKEGGFGLGLLIVKKVIDAHGGSVCAYNTDDGVAFEIKF